MRSTGFHTLILVASSLLTSTALGQPWKPGDANGETGPYRIKAATSIDCQSSPFGRQLPIGLDQEPLVIRRTSGTPTIQSFIHDISGTNLPLRSNLAYTTVNAASTRVATTIGRFTGDGQQQAAVVTARSNGTLALSLGWRNPTTLSTEIRSTWEWTDVGAGPPTVLDLQIAAADLNGSRDGREELVIAARWSNQTVRVFALSVADNGTIAQGTNQTLGISTFSTAAGSESALRLAAGDMLLEGRDQVLLMTAAPGAAPAAWRYRILRYTDSGLPSTRFTARSFERPIAGSTDLLRRLTLHIADLGGSAAAEIVVHQQQTASGTAGTTSQRVHYLTTTRGTNNVITDFQFRDGGESFIDTNSREFAATVGDLDRRPPAEIVVARQRGDNNLLQIEAYRVGLNAQGFPTSIGLANPAIVATAPLDVTGPQQLDVSVGDVDGDGIGDAFVVVRDNNRTKLRRFAIARPSPPEAAPVAGTFALQGGFDFDTTLADTTDIFVRVPDWDRDGVIANIGSTCRRVREPLVRTVVNLPPFWSRLQGSLGDFNAAIGRQASSGATNETRYGTFNSHDVSGYVGLQVGGEVLGIGVQATVKATAGYNYQASRTEIRGSELTTQVTETQSQTEGGGLVVLEENTYDCFDYAVQQNGAVSDSSDLRLCELIRTNANGDPLRTMIASDLETWDTFTAAGTGGAGTRPAQWAPLRPDWANLALFRPVTTNLNVEPIGPPAGFINDGLFDTPLQMSSASGQPYFQIDLGEVRDITNIRVFRLQPDFTALRDLSLFVSTTPMVGAAVPTGPGVVRFDPDPQTRNGFDRWNLWTRGPAPDFEPLRGRYVRVQRTGPAAGGFLTEIQVFGDTHREPPAYPQSVCDPTPNDGVFFARVLDPTASPPAYRRIHVRGDLEWTGVTAADAACGTNHANVRAVPIWENVTIGGTGVNSWDLFTGTTNVIGRAGSISHSTRVGVELDVEAGALVQVVAGGAYEWSTGVTEEQSTTMYWGSGLNYSGQVRGFPGGSNLNCSYLPRPFAYRASDRSNAGYEHQFTVVDYVVRDGPSWNRLGPNLPPRDCFPPPPEPVFGSGFEP